MLSVGVDTVVCIEYWQRSGQHCQQLALICHFFAYRMLASDWSVRAILSSDWLLVSDDDHSLVMIRGPSIWYDEISLHFHLNLSETTLNNVSESAASKVSQQTVATTSVAWGKVIIYPESFHSLWRICVLQQQTKCTGSERSAWN